MTDDSARFVDGSVKSQCRRFAEPSEKLREIAARDECDVESNARRERRGLGDFLSRRGVGRIHRVEIDDCPATAFLGETV